MNVVVPEGPQALLKITDAMMVGRLRKELSYQFGMEMATRTQRLKEAGMTAQKIRDNRALKTMRHMAEIPTREYMRIIQEQDRYFFREHKNIRKLVQDNPELKGGVGV